MRRNSIICTLTIVILSFTAAGASTEIATDQSTRIEDMAAGMEMLFLDLLGTSDIQPAFRDHGNGVYSLSVSLDQLPLDSGFAARAKAKAVTNLHHGHMVSDPSSPKTLIHAAEATLNISYNLWWAAVNPSGDDAELKTTWSHKGPGADAKDSQTLTYDAASIVVFWTTNVVHTKAGIFKSFVKISGSSNSKTKGGCFSQ